MLSRTIERIRAIFGMGAVSTPQPAQLAQPTPPVLAAGPAPRRPSRGTTILSATATAGGMLYLEALRRQSAEKAKDRLQYGAGTRRS